MKTELCLAEKLVKAGAASLQKNIETVGGKLYLTNQRLVFEAHKFNIQSGLTEVELSNIQSSEKCWTKFLGFLPLFPNSLAVYTKQGKEYRFVLFGRGAWSAAIKAQKSGLRPPRNAEPEPAAISEPPPFVGSPPPTTYHAKKVAKSAATIGAVIGAFFGIIAKGKLITKLVLIAIFAPILALVFGAITFLATWLVFKVRGK